MTLDRCYIHLPPRGMRCPAVQGIFTMENRET
jgi:hypothetical protein